MTVNNNTSPTGMTGPNTIVLVHGLWMTPRSWEGWVDRYTRRGYNVLAPAYPGFDIEVEALRADPARIESLTIPETVAHLERIIAGLDRPPILMGHSAGGLLVQLLLDHGFGAAGVVIDSAPPEGVRDVPLSQVKSLFPVLNNPANRHRAVPFTPEQFHYAFTNTLSEEESARVYDRYHIPAPGNWVWISVLSNFTPGHQEAWVDFKNANRSALLFIAGSVDHIMPASLNRSNANHYTSSAVTDYNEFPGRSHYTVGQEGWEEVADAALAWAVEHAASADVRGPTAGRRRRAERNWSNACRSPRSRRSIACSTTMRRRSLATSTPRGTTPTASRICAWPSPATTIRVSRKSPSSPHCTTSASGRTAPSTIWSRPSRWPARTSPPRARRRGRGRSPR
jgi:pimeloyl-ACP methyl ester carboxylesterase